MLISLGPDICFGFYYDQPQDTNCVQNILMNGVNSCQYGVNSWPRKYSIHLCHIECCLTITETYLSDHACTQYGDRTINTTKMSELDDKFKRLHQAGKEGNLVLNTLAGSAWETLSVRIGPG